MLPLLKLLPPEVAPHHRVAVLVNAIGEVLAGHADHAAFPVLQVRGALATGAGESVVTPTSTAALSVPRSAQAIKTPLCERG